MVEPDKSQKTAWRRVACWISKATFAQAHARACDRARARAPTSTPKHARARAQTHRSM